MLTNSKLLALAAVVGGALFGYLAAATNPQWDTTVGCCFSHTESHNVEYRAFLDGCLRLLRGW